MTWGFPLYHFIVIKQGYLFHVMSLNELYMIQNMNMDKSFKINLETFRSIKDLYLSFQQDVLSNLK